jgi:hypothetical protein
MLQPLALCCDAAASSSMLRCCSLKLYAAVLQASNMWRYRTASGSQRQCCSLYCRLPTRGNTALQVAPNGDAAASSYAAMLQPLALCCRLPTVAIPHCKLFRTRLPTAMPQPPKWLPTMLPPLTLCCLLAEYCC